MNRPWRLGSSASAVCTWMRSLGLCCKARQTNASGSTFRRRLTAWEFHLGSSFCLRRPSGVCRCGSKAPWKWCVRVPDSWSPLFLSPRLTYSGLIRRQSFHLLRQSILPCSTSPQLACYASHSSRSQCSGSGSCSVAHWYQLPSTYSWR